jgi:hypothetical protein
VTSCAIAAAALLLLGAAGAVADTPPAAGDAKESPRPEPVYILLDAPTDLDELLRRLARPDFTLRPGPEPSRPEGKGEEAGTAPAVISVAARGEVAGDLARLTVELGIVLAGVGPREVPIRLDGLTVTDLREGDRELPHRVVRDGGWLVEVAGEGKHQIRVSLLVAVKPTAEGRRVELAIPEAASTRVELTVPGAVADAEAGPRDPLAVEPVEAGARSRLKASLSPRRRLDLRWRAAAEPGSQGPPALAAQGAIAVDIDPGTFRAVSSWSIRSDRGTARRLRLWLDPDDELVGAELDGQPVPADATRVAAATELTIPLDEPLRPGQSRRLSVTTRRPFPAGRATSFVYRGLALADAPAQSGVVAIARSGDDLWVSGTAGRGLRQIAPKSDLPSDLRARPGTVLAYQFLEQPFELGLRIEPSPPLVRVESRATVSVSPTVARVDAWLDYQVSRGRIFEVQVALPASLELESVGPDAVVESSQQAEADESATDAPRTLTIRLTPRARDDPAFRIHLVGRRRLDRAGAIAVGLFRPRAATVRGGWVAVLTGREVVADLAEDGRGGPFQPAGLEPPADWPWPADRAAFAGRPALWLRHDADPPALPLRVAVFARTLSEQTTLAARLDRRGLEVRQETTVQVRHGTLAAVDVAVPRSVDGSWEVESDEVARREALAPGPDGDPRYRLTLRREADDIVALRFRFRVPLEPGLSPGRPTRLVIPRLRIPGAAEATAQVHVTADAGIELAAATGRDWSPLPEEEPSAGPSIRLAAAGSGVTSPAVVATALPPATLPRVVAPRLWLRTFLGADGELRATASYWIEAHESALSLALPAGAEWVGAWVDGEPAAEVARLPEPGGYRVAFPDGAPPGPLLLRLDYTIPARAVAAGWGAPRLLEGGVVQQTLWEVRIPWNQAVVGVPPGWVDENDWHWDLYVWKRRPARDPAALAEWVGVPSPRAGDFADEDRGYHGYLFGRPGSPSRLRPAVVHRAGLVAMFSGLVLGLGILLLSGPPRFRLIGAVALLALVALAAALDPGVTFLAAQSSAVGVALLVPAALIQRLVERRRGRAPRPEPSGSGPAPLTGSSRRLAATVGSDESTLIRPRPGTTVDHAGPSRPAAAGAENVAAEGPR